MNFSLQYVKDKDGEILAFQLTIAVWAKLLAQLKKYEQVLKIRADLQKSFKQVAAFNKTIRGKQTLGAFLKTL